MKKPRLTPKTCKFAIRDVPAGITGLFQRFAGLQACLFLDGSGDIQPNRKLNRYSFMAADPVDTIACGTEQSFNFLDLRDLIAKYQSNLVEGLPPFQGGLAGMIGYEFNAKIENVSAAAINEFPAPQLMLNVYDVVVAIDHHLQAAWLISHGWLPNGSQSCERAAERLQQFKSIVFAEETMSTQLPLAAPSSPSEIPLTPESEMHRVQSDLTVELYSDLSQQQFLAMVRKGVQYIHAGDVFQVNLSQRLLTPVTKSSPQLHCDMRSANPAPFSGYFDFGEGQLISASPERLIRSSNRQLETRPIKGTRRRTHHPEIDLATENELLDSEKDRAENIMIVDLMRNDLSRVAIPDSVRVSQLCGVESYPNVLHLVSVIEAEMAAEFDCVQLIQAVFPGGSITGAPKIRAMEIIAELEPTVRGPYCGSLGYINFNGDMDFSILIRSVTAKDGWWQIPVGGGIVADSKAEIEYEETWTKAIGMLRAITGNSAAIPSAHRQPNSSDVQGATLATDSHHANNGQRNGL